MSKGVCPECFSSSASTVIATDGTTKVLSPPPPRRLNQGSGTVNPAHLPEAVTCLHKGVVPAPVGNRGGGGWIVEAVAVAVVSMMVGEVGCEKGGELADIVINVEVVWCSSLPSMKVLYSPSGIPSSASKKDAAGILTSLAGGDLCSLWWEWSHRSLSALAPRKD